jgi:hypothetical protein
VLVVILDVPSGMVMTENVFGISPEGEVLWQIGRIPETSSDPANLYVGFFKQFSDSLHIGSWSGDIVSVNVSNGKAKWIGLGR